jgi:hypothetical protein
MTVQFSWMAALPARCLQARSSLVRRLSLVKLKQLSSLGLTPEDIQVLRH